MHRTICLLAALAICLAPLFSLPALGEDSAPLTLRVFLFDPCGGCASAGAGCRDCAIENQVYGRLLERFQDLVDSGRMHIKVHNLLFAAVRKGYEDYLKGFGLYPDFRDRVPLYVLGEPGWGEALVGEENEPRLPALALEVLARMPADAAWRREPREGQEFTVPRSDPLDDIQPEDSLILYFFKDYCPYCKELDVLFDALPDQITLPDGSVSRVRFVSLEKQVPAQMAVVQRYYDRLFVHPDRQLVPMIIIGKKALYLKEEIVPGLLPALLAGEGLLTDRSPLAALGR